MSNANKPDYFFVRQDVTLFEKCRSFFRRAIYTLEIALVRYGYPQIIYTAVVRVLESYHFQECIGKRMKMLLQSYIIVSKFYIEFKENIL